MAKILLDSGIEYPDSHSKFKRLDRRENLADNAASCYGTGDFKWTFGSQMIAFFSVLIAGGVGAIFPVLIKTTRVFRVPVVVMDISRFFGIGVIFSTAMVHIFTSSLSRLKDVCVRPVLGNYAHYSEVLFILSIFLMHLFEHLMVLYLSGSESMPHLQTIEITEKETANSHKNEFSRNNAILGDAAVLELKTDCTYKNTTDSDDIVRQKGLGSGANSGHGHGLRLLDSKRKRDISSYILEFSVSFHSVIVGLTVGMTSESTAKLLAIALSFHQFFEGIAMGERLVDLYSNSKKHKLMFVGAAVYMFSTPLGQVIGMSIHSSFAPRSPSSLIVLGFMEAICSGILLYSSVVDLILPEFSSRDFLEMRNWRKICCFLSMYLGTAGMSIVGHWA